MLTKINIFIKDIKEKGIYRSITHRVYKHKSLLILVPIINALKPEFVIINGLKLYIDKNDTVVSESLIYNKTWSKHETKLVSKYLKKGDVFVDVGAHIGYFTLLASKIVGPVGRVYAFEPNTNNFKLLQKNVKRNKLNNVICINKEMVCYGEPSTVLDPSALAKLYGGEASFYKHEHEHNN